MGCQIVFSPQAIADLESTVHYIAQEDPAVAIRVGETLIKRVSILEEFPLIGSLYSKRPGIRKLVSRPYIIFYRPRLADNTVEILRYWHGARSEPQWRET